MLHIFIAITSIGLASYTLLKPSAKSFFLSYATIAATVFSGIYLVVAEPAKMLHTCVAGLVYIAMISIILIISRARLAHVINKETKA
jgi:hypothetical protein